MTLFASCFSSGAGNKDEDKGEGSKTDELEPEGSVTADVILMFAEAQSSLVVTTGPLEGCFETVSLC